MQTIRTEHGNWKLYTARRHRDRPQTTRHSAITYTIDEKLLWGKEGPVLWPTINTPFGVFQTRESLAQRSSAKFEWELVSGPPKPESELLSQSVYLWSVGLARNAFRKEIPQYVIEQLLGALAVRVALALNAEEDRKNGLVSSEQTAV